MLLYRYSWSLLFAVPPTAFYCLYDWARVARRKIDFASLADMCIICEHRVSRFDDCAFSRNGNIIYKGKEELLCFISHIAFL